MNDYFFFLVLRKAFLYLNPAFHLAESDPCVPLRKSPNLILRSLGSLASPLAFLKTMPPVIAMFISLFAIFKNYNHKSLQISLMLLPSKGCIRSGATSTIGSMTNALLCISGCGRLSLSDSITISSIINMSISITLS